MICALGKNAHAWSLVLFSWWFLSLLLLHSLSLSNSLLASNINFLYSPMFSFFIILLYFLEDFLNSVFQAFCWIFHFRYHIFNFWEIYSILCKNSILFSFHNGIPALTCLWDNEFPLPWICPFLFIVSCYLFWMLSFMLRILQPEAQVCFLRPFWRGIWCLWLFSY